MIQIYYDPADGTYALINTTLNQCAWVMNPDPDAPSDTSGTIGGGDALDEIDSTFFGSGCIHPTDKEFEGRCVFMETFPTLEECKKYIRLLHMLE